MNIFGIFVKVVVTGPVEAARGGGGGRVLACLAAIAVVASFGYHFLESALLGLQASAHEANVALAWGAAKVAVLVAVGAVVWVLIGRRRQVAQRPAVAEHDAAMLAATQRQAIAARPTPARVEARRVERIGTKR